jgi:hypothetical protein
MERVLGIPSKPHQWEVREYEMGKKGGLVTSYAASSSPSFSSFYMEIQDNE